MTAAVILVVDDSELTRAVLGRKLKQVGYEVIEAADSRLYEAKAAGRCCVKP